MEKAKTSTIPGWKGLLYTVGLEKKDSVTLEEFTLAVGKGDRKRGGGPSFGIGLRFIRKKYLLLLDWLGATVRKFLQDEVGSCDWLFSR